MARKSRFSFFKTRRGRIVISVGIPSRQIPSTPSLRSSWWITASQIDGWRIRDCHYVYGAASSMQPSKLRVSSSLATSRKNLRRHSMLPWTLRRLLYSSPEIIRSRHRLSGHVYLTFDLFIMPIIPRMTDLRACPPSGIMHRVMSTHRVMDVTR